MSKRLKTGLILAGAACALLLAAASWYAVACQEGRLVCPMDFSAYTFQAGDLPMWIAIGALGLYVLALSALLLRALWRGRRYPQRFTRTLNPKLGLLGFLGFAGFLGFWTYPMGQIFPFAFFAFFGFFGFFYEGKLSHTMRDERYCAEQKEAQLRAYRIGFSLLFLLMVLAGQGRAAERTGAVLLAGLGLILGATLFLSEYFLYRLDQDDPSGSEE